MTGNVPQGPEDGVPGDGAPRDGTTDRREIEEELARFAAALADIGPADPAVEPGADLRRRLVRAAGT
ncbi:MAG: hypothetical protein F4114_16860 [Rhodospirillaceae bacterium]|nr:hypothetical protein [Rhodospirillaceae bacterium]MYB15248.1 hypothetical protein [Rhodospirillaceae bacterium]MYI50741.1 hypothetical protein [Rhodospirillaceae bacterium]